MRHIYENRSGNVHRLFLMNENKISGSQMVFASGSRIELTYPGLDNYVPHLLIKVNEHGFDVSASVEAERRSRLPLPQAEVLASVENNKSVELSSAETQLKSSTEPISTEEVNKLVTEVNKDTNLKVTETTKVKTPKKHLFGKNK